MCAAGPGQSHPCSDPRINPRSGSVPRNDPLSLASDWIFFELFASMFRPLQGYSTGQFTWYNAEARASLGMTNSKREHISFRHPNANATDANRNGVTDQFASTKNKHVYRTTLLQDTLILKFCIRFPPTVYVGTNAVTGSTVCEVRTGVALCTLHFAPPMKGRPERLTSPHHISYKCR